MAKAAITAKTNKGFARAPVPALKARNIRIGSQGQLKRSWPVAPGAFFRIYQDEPLTLECSFTKKMRAPRVTLRTDLLAAKGKWGDIPFSETGPGACSLSALPRKNGIFRFKLKYSPDNGATWFLDRTPFTKVIVDPVAARDIRQYTLVPTASGRIGEWKAQLSRIRDMGFNVVHLLPVTRMDVSESPYAAADLFSIDPSYLNPNDKRSGLDQFEDFVVDAEKKGIGLCLDLVLNHIGLSSVMAQRTPEWIVPDKNEANGLLRAGCWHMNSWIKWHDLVRINYDHPEPAVKKDLWAYMSAYARFWTTYASYSHGMVRLDNLHASHQEFIAALLEGLHGSFPGLVVQAEYFSDSNTLIKTASESAIALFLANPWEHPFAKDLRKYFAYLHDISSQIRFLTPIATHDTGSIAQLYGKPEAIVPRYFATALMSTGQTGLVQGNEHGLPRKIEFIGRYNKPAIEQPGRFSPVIGKINTLHASYALFHQTGNLEFVDNCHGAIIAALRRDLRPGKDCFLLCANLDTANAYSLAIETASWKRAGKGPVLHEMMDGGRFEAFGHEFRIDLQPCGVKAFWFEYV
ncbi:MAG: hypothetical protein A2350_08555 [Candidatus Raymondbacteria bacterium RifOxyB12_full_50_8]|uniref:Glycogen debranching enzyme glucanotransferase domain-containing protein n=1 Tax=Candidatus Raymondbacteria bacterium RIFOXYD12_FULL_49_13 TaxID=1817890 RepID=A0A1F7FI09_UNCRA|nr:MAG: hypothetical protein A2248_21470 [Candidatus Raymondbacteria bacterium RIFOXYA2_FULL_49_16]OGJ94697.1 MAG: hypothetical protein A2350_08555 [Candidatus Raymondbacteria bacterium RifOxyB12_full_50_8]OGK06355.1 MAG: hypothetical protein A2519_08790 [Candidatus Raymondbacteria bacterium RIFOXYD12_FULL_49_13]OGP40689.1 MAG: hypothetical protein A2324_03540 [Candidatus Raymondbacteria bacterium RIFOXYB2_FULL_49_35]